MDKCEHGPDWWCAKCRPDIVEEMKRIHCPFDNGPLPQAGDEVVVNIARVAVKHFPPSDAWFKCETCGAMTQSSLCHCCGATTVTNSGENLK
jgi:hypothetical protein